MMYLIVWTFLELVIRYVDAGCTGMHCNDHGTISEEGNYCHCLCDPDFSGNQCEIQKYCGLSTGHGTISEEGNNCHCLCDPDFSGDQCEYRLWSSGWPEGPYALPMRKDGCPGSIQNGWYMGYINMTFTTPFSQSEICREQTNDSNNFSDEQLPSNMLGPYDDFNFQMNFCYKSENHTENDKLPFGAETFYSAEKRCPSGFYEKFSSIYLPPLLQWNADGHLPYFEMISDTQQTRLRFLYCEWTNDTREPISYGFKERYMYIKNEDTECNFPEEENSYPYPIYSEGCTEVQFCDSYGPRWQDVSACSYLMFDKGRTLIFREVNIFYSAGPLHICGLKVNNDKWAFKHDDRQRCIIDRVGSMNDRKRIICQRVVQGRYVTLQYETPTVLEDHTIVLDELSYRSELGTPKLSCFESLGMEDFHIQDYQIRASSSEAEHTPDMARPQYSGWCATKEDTQPFVQVDVLTITSFDGIVIYNWEKVTVGNYTNNMYSTSGILQGAYSFSIMFGSSDSHMTLYKEREFRTDVSRPFTEPQTFQFADPFMARFIRVYPSSHPTANQVCLKFELLGCKQLGIHSLQCSLQSQKEIFETTTAFLPVSNFYTELNNLTQDDCIDLCRQYHTTCTGVQYSTSLNICRVFFSDNRQNYHEVTRDDKFDYLATVNCIPGRLASESSPSEEGLITSTGYPFEYGSTDTSQLLRLQQYQETTQGNMKLIFTDISFKKQKGKEDGIHLSQCTEGIYIEDTYAVDNNKLTYRHNGMRLVVILQPTEHYTYTHVWQDTCYSSTWEAENQRSRGYRAHVVLEDTPTCTMNNITLLRTCERFVMRLQTFTLMGYPSREHLKYTWNVVPSVATDTIAFTFTEFYLSCQTDSRVTITYAFGVINHYCNANRPIGTIYITTPYLNITMDTSLILQSIVLEGFDANYFTVKNPVVEYQTQDTFETDLHVCTFEDTDVCRDKIYGIPGGDRGFSVKRVTRWNRTTDADGNPNGHFLMISATISYMLSDWIELPVQLPKRYYRYWYIPGGRVEQFHPAGRYSMELLLADAWQMSVCYETENGLFGSKLYFKGNYSMFMLDNILLLDNCSVEPDAVVDFKRVCSSTFGKCYSFHFERKKISWTDAANTCASLNSSLVRIGSLAEDSLLKTIFFEYWFNRRIWVDREIIPYVHIGLTRYIDESGAVIESWTDGRPLTYTTWEKYEPKNIYLNRCTRMKMQQYNSTGDWSSEPCDTRSSNDGATHFICEQSYKNDTLSSEERMPMRESLNEQIDAGLHVENSTLFHCSSGEIISILSVCNGIAECFSASDEVNCDRGSSLCRDKEFQCGNGNCVHVSVLCDHVADCRDASDEFCSEESCVVNEEFSCENGQCIPLFQRCDATTHCLDNSDELNCVTCNDTIAFHCDSLLCIPVRMVCDNVIDCQDGSDETSCANVEYKTCDDVLNTGFNDSGTYNMVSGQFVHCDFDQINAGIITMSYYNIDWKVLVADKEYVTNSMTFFKYALNANYSCTQDFTPSLKPLEAEIAQLENLTYPGYDMLAVFEIDEFSQENGYPVINHTYVEVSIVERSEYNLRVFVHTTFDTEKFRLPSNPVVCIKSTTAEHGGYFPCGHNLKPISMTSVCVYQLDEYGNQTGCRNLEHLQNCKDTACIAGFVKCPDSYCIPQEYVCNGRIDCENGNDELGCWCDDSNGTFVVAVSGENPFEEQQAFDIASKYVDHMSDVFILKIAATGLSSMKRLIYPSERIVSVYDTYSLDASLLMKNPSTTKFVFISVNLQETNKDIEDTIMSTANNSKSELFIFRVFIDTEISTAVTVSVSDEVHNTNDPNLKPKVTEVRVQNRNHLSTAGSLLFPGICRGKPRRDCDGRYVCMFSQVCIPKDRLCDNVSNCPYGDDERLCAFICPSNCKCDGLSVSCSNTKFTWSQLTTISTETRFLDLSQNSELKGFPLTFSMTFPYLTVLNVSNSDVQELSKEWFKSVPNLRILDCRYNDISTLLKDSFVGLKHLIHIYLEGDRFFTTTVPGAFTGLYIKDLSLRHCTLHTLERRTFYGLGLTYLDLSANNIIKIDNFAFDGLSTITLDITDNPIRDFGKDIFYGIRLLTAMKTPAYKLCCFRPDYLNENKCEPREDEFSSCDDLMRNSALQALLWIIGLLAILGNTSSLVFRLVFDRERLKIGYGIFVTNLAVADLLMGIYLLIIAVTDVIYRDRYILVDDYWRSSGWCKFCGFISTMSSEASVLFICLITIDRIIVIKYPFGQVRITTKRAIVFSGVCWLLVSVVSVIPIVYGDYFEGRFYSSRAVCTALPLTRDRPPGWLYSVVIFIGFNLIAFVLIAFGQCSIYAEVRKASKRKRKMNVSRSNDLTVAKNLLLVVTTDFMSWFPIGCMGVMAMAGYPIPSDMYAWTVVLILPINSALNPVMYTYTVWIGRRNMNPSVDEQNHNDGSKETAQAVEITCLRLYDGIKKRTDLRSVENILMERQLTTDKTVYIARRLLEYLASLHHIDLVVEDITGTHVFTKVNKVGNMVFGEVYLLELPREVRRPTDKAANMRSVGLFLQRLMKRPYV